jgi:hypothetical protein
MTDCISEYSQTYGVRIASASPTLRGNRIENNTSYGVYISSGTPDLGANNPNDKGRNTIRNNDSARTPYPWQVYNGSGSTVNAYYNYWEYTTATEIDNRIRDNEEGGGEVRCAPWLTEDESLPVVLSSFTSLFSDGQVILKWRAEAQVSNIGWDVYRSEVENGEYQKVNSSRIGGEVNSDIPTDYQFIDTDVQEGKTYFYYIEDIDVLGNRNRSSIISLTIPVSKIEVIKDVALPGRFTLFQNYPNPFNPETWIPYQLPKASSVTITIYAQDGKLIRTLAWGEKEAGFYLDKGKSAYWDGRNDGGERVGSGVYFYQLVAGNFREVRKMILLK